MNRESSWSGPGPLELSIGIASGWPVSRKTSGKRMSAEDQRLAGANTDRAAPIVKPSIHFGRSVAPSKAIERRLLSGFESKKLDSVSPPVIHRASTAPAG